MRRLPTGVLALLLLATPALAQKEFGFDNRKASGQPYLDPEETVKRMTVAPEFEVKLFAGEPLLANPIAFTIDERGRVWAIECFEYPSKTPAGKMPRDRIVILEDTDGDGKADKRTVFAEGKDFPERFDMASGLEVGHGGVYVGAPPYLWFIENKGDKPGKFEKLASGFGSQDTHETLNTFQWGPDGWLYGLHGVFTQSNVKSQDGPELRMNAAVWRFHPKTKKFEVFAEGTSNPWGMDWRNTDGQFVLACCVIPHLYHIVPGGIYRRQAGTSYNPHAYGAIQEISDHTFHRESGWAHAGLISLDAPHIPEKYRNSVIFGSIHGCSIKQNVLKPNGSSYTASRGDDFLVSGDKNFRPINLKWGPHGDIYLIDWHDQNPCHQAKADSWDYERGRVYRIQLKGTETKKPDDLGALSDDKLLDLALTGRTPWHYRTALRLMTERLWSKWGVKNAKGEPKLTASRFRDLREWFKPLQDQVDQTTSTDVKIRATFLAANQTIAPSSHPQFLHDPAASWLLRQTPTYLAIMAHEEFASIASTEKSPLLRRELASMAVRVSNSELPQATQAASAITRALMSHKDDANDPQIPHLVWLAYEKVVSKKDGASTPAEKELAWLAEQSPTNVFVRDQIVPRVMRRLVATGQPGDLALCVKFVADVKDANSRQKALDGLAVALADQVIDAPAGWPALQKELLAAGDPKLTPLVRKLAVAFRDPESLKRAHAVAHDPKATPGERAEALRQLVALKHPDAQKVVTGFAAMNFDMPLRTEAVRLLAAFPDPNLAANTIANWHEYPPALQPDLVNSLASRKEWARALLLALKEKKIDRTAVSDSAITRIQGFRDKELDKLIEDAWGRARATPADLEKVVVTMRGELAAGPGSFARGKAVFEAQCAKCHQFDGKGASVGPPLDGAGRDIEYLLANVLDPNRVIGAPYFVRQATLSDGQLVQGVLAAEDDRSLTLKIENGVTKRISKADLDGPVKVLEKSMMPEGLGYAMTTQDFRDLVRYAMASPFPATATVDDKAVSVPVSGRIPVPAGGATVSFTVTASKPLTTRLLVGAGGAVAASLDGKPIGTGGAGTGGRPEPDRDAFPVTLSAGTHTITLAVKGGDVYARLLDPDRVLSYTEGK